MDGLVERLAERNRKERYWLLRDALGARNLSDDFRERLSIPLQKIDQSITVPPTAWWAMDYHFDWLCEVMELPATRPSRTIQDLDLIVAFGRNLVLVEAKCDSSWTNAQVGPKITRLGELGVSGQGKENPRGVRIFFVLASPDWRVPQRLEIPNEWLCADRSIPWMKMSAPPKRTQ